MYKKLWFLLVVSILLPLIASASIDTAWTRKYNGSGDSTDASTAITIDDLGNVYVAGYSYAETTGSDFILIKYDQSGNQEWLSRYNTPENWDEYVNGMAMDKSGNIYLTGITKKVSAGIKGDFLTVRFRPDGSVDWAVKYNGTGNGDDFAWVIATDKTGNVFVGGTVTNEGTGKDFAVIKYNPKGDAEWIATYNGPGHGTDDLYEMAVDSKGNAYLCGGSDGDKSYEDFALVKFNASGDQQWVARHSSKPTGGTDYAKALALDKAGNVYVTGASNYNFMTIKYSPAGKELWAKAYADAEKSEDPNLIGVDDSSNVYVAGTSHGADMLDDWLVVKYDAKGNELWHYIYDGAEGGDDLPKAMALDQEGNSYVTGGTYTKSYGPNFVTIKFRRESGTPSGYVEYKGYAFDEPKAIAVDKEGNIYVTGVSEGYISGYDDIITIKYIQR